MSSHNSGKVGVMANIDYELWKRMRDYLDKKNKGVGKTLKIGVSKIVEEALIQELSKKKYK